MSHTPTWLGRKFKQAQGEQWEEHKARVLEGFQSLMLLLDAAFNNGKEFEKILSPSEETEEKKEVESKFVTGVWWKKE